MTAARRACGDGEVIGCSLVVAATLVSRAMLCLMRTVLARCGLMVLAAVVGGCGGVQSASVDARVPVGGLQPRGLGSGFVEGVALSGDDALIGHPLVASATAGESLKRLPGAGPR
jgi:hypothetical protein